MTKRNELRGIGKRKRRKDERGEGNSRSKKARALF